MASRSMSWNCAASGGVRQPFRPRELCWCLGGVDADELRAVEERQLGDNRARNLCRARPHQRDHWERVECHHDRHLLDCVDRGNRPAQAHCAHRVEVFGRAGVVNLDRGVQRNRPDADAHLQRVRGGGVLFPDALRRHRREQCVRCRVEVFGVLALDLGVAARPVSEGVQVPQVDPARLVDVALAFLWRKHGDHAEEHHDREDEHHWAHGAPGHHHQRHHRPDGNHHDHWQQHFQQRHRLVLVCLWYRFGAELAVR